MACFLIPTAEAIVTTIITQVIKKKEKEAEEKGIKTTTEIDKMKLRWSRKLSWLNNLLWGGAFLLAFEHIWHGEVVPWFPFLTAANSAEDTAMMLHEMSTVGVSMAILVTVVWVVMVLISNAMEKRVQKEELAKSGGVL